MGAPTLDDRFPDKSAEIRTLRQCNPTFDEICRDYELLVGDLSHLPVGSAEQGRRPEVHETLDALAEEITEILEDSEPGAIHQSSGLRTTVNSHFQGD